MREKRIKEYEPYGFNINYEYKTYQMIGYDYRLEYTSRQRRWNVRLKIHKFRNRGERKYRRLDTYDEWKKYILVNTPQDDKNIENEIRYLNTFLRKKEYWIEMYKAVVMQMYMTIITVGITVSMAMHEGQTFKDFGHYLIGYGIIIMFIFLYVYFRTRKDSEMAEFYKDYIEILESKMK